MSFVPPAVDHVAKKIARYPGVEASYVNWDGAIDAVLETAFDRTTRQEVIGIGMRAMVPVRVFYRMPDGDLIGEDEAKQYESLEDYYTDIHVAGFAGDTPKAPPEDIGGDSYGRVRIGKAQDDRDAGGQLKLARIRASSRGRPVVGWRYGDKSVRKGDKVKFKRACCLQWTMGRTVNVRPGATGTVSQMSSRRPIAYLSLGGNDKIELPIHAVGHVYDVMVDPNLESVRPQQSQQLTERVRSSLTPQMKRLVMAIGFGRPPGADDTPTNTAKFTGPDQPDLMGYTSGGPEEDQLVPPPEKGDDEPKVRVRQNGAVKKKTVILSKRK